MQFPGFKNPDALFWWCARLITNMNSKVLVVVIVLILTALTLSYHLQAGTYKEFLNLPAS